MSQNLKAEIEVFNKHLNDLLATADGKFALVVGEKIVGTYDTYADAVQEGYKVAGLDAQFLVKKISLVGDAAHFSRPLVPPTRQAYAQH
ncbi:hypothetical protein M2D07_006700 [Pseudomonas sp. BGr12]|uniref:hypothetical protein n=1 Tax=Pseudomonas sp. BGr12 TaxID=2936269 RepID=UPI002559C6F1|nr:hypothetical protein [Pseudomonas sp. BJa5]MDL2426704.1 hypothetical protein [Pseudomonas sp. BJa5]